jgi:phosphoglycolate phosphatase
MVRTVLFDLDGTLVDTAPDLAHVLNQMRIRRNMPPLPLHSLRPQASHGSQGLIRLGLGLGSADAGFSAVREEFLDLYASHLAEQSTLFPGMHALLDHLDQAGIGWGGSHQQAGAIYRALAGPA